MIRLRISSLIPGNSPAKTETHGDAVYSVGSSTRAISIAQERFTVSAIFNEELESLLIFRLINLYASTSTDVRVEH